MNVRKNYIFLQAKQRESSKPTVDEKSSKSIVVINKFSFKFFLLRKSMQSIKTPFHLIFWSCYFITRLSTIDPGCLAKVQRCVFNIIYNPFAVLFVIICILLNTLFMALDHHNMPQELETVLRIGNFVSAQQLSFPKYSHEPTK